MKLTIELVPATSWCNNVRSLVKRSVWDKLRHSVYEASGFQCQICGSTTDHTITSICSSRLECHEIWSYDDKTKIQTLTRLQALCSRCHEVKHYGRAEATGNGDRALQHLCKVNKITEQEAISLVNEAFEVWDERSKYEWKLDLTWLKERGIEFKRR